MSQTTTSEQVNESDKKIEIPVDSVSVFIQEILKVSKETGTEIFYRGHAATTWELLPSIFRKPKDKAKIRGIEREHLLFRDMVARLPQSFSGCESALDYLVQMQHYELPTRLLDVTTNPLVALYFACQPVPAPAENENGKVFLFSVKENRIKHYDSDTASVLANLAKCKNEEISMPLYEKGVSFYGGLKQAVDSSTPLPNPGACPSEVRQYILSNMPSHEVRSDYLKWFNELDSIQILLHQIREEKPHFQPLIQPCELANIFLVKAKYSNSRIINQSGAFFIFGLGLESDKECNKPLRLVKEISEEIPSDWIKHEFTISKCKKEQILEELAQLGITESYIYPEIDKYAKELKKRYNL
jgi:FRG domain protein